MKRLLLIGGGHSHVEVLRRLGLRPIPGVEITLINRSRFAPYSGMLPGLIAGHYTFEQSHIDLERVAKFAGARLIHHEAREIDANGHEVALTDGTRISYDTASINIGSSSLPPQFHGNGDFIIPTRPVEGMLDAWRNLQQRTLNGTLNKVAVIGGGAASVELLFAMQYRLLHLTEKHLPEFTLIAGADELLPGHNPRVREMFHRLLVAHRVGIVIGAQVTRVEPGYAITRSGGRVAADVLIWAGGAIPNISLRARGVETDDAGYIPVNEHLQSRQHPDLFAVGDCAAPPGGRVPKSGVYAVRQGPILAENLRRALTAQPLRRYHPQQRALALISSGRRHAIASYGRHAVAGECVWSWKDRIDRAFVRRYNSLDERLGRPALPG